MTTEVAEPTEGQLEAALARHTSAAGEVFPSALGLIAAEEHWSGRLWEVLRLLAADMDTMRYAAGGDRPGEIAECAARWTESGLALEDIALVLGSGGYDPDPFVALSKAGILRTALRDENGATRRIDGERAGAWISDQLALASPEETVARIQRIAAAGFPDAS